MQNLLLLWYSFAFSEFCISVHCTSNYSSHTFVLYLSCTIIDLPEALGESPVIREKMKYSLDLDGLCGLSKSNRSSGQLVTAGSAGDSVCDSAQTRKEKAKRKRKTRSLKTSAVNGTSAARRSHTHTRRAKKQKCDCNARTSEQQKSVAETTGREEERKVTRATEKEGEKEMAEREGEREKLIVTSLASPESVVCSSSYLHGRESSLEEHFNQLQIVRTRLF